MELDRQSRLSRQDGWQTLPVSTADTTMSFNLAENISPLKFVAHASQLGFGGHLLSFLIRWWIPLSDI